MTYSMVKKQTTIGAVDQPKTSTMFGLSLVGWVTAIGIGGWFLLAKRKHTGTKQSLGKRLEDMNEDKELLRSFIRSKGLGDELNKYYESLEG